MDGLWHIPIQKKSEQENNYRKPILNGLPYSKTHALACR